MVVISAARAVLTAFRIARALGSVIATAIVPEGVESTEGRSPSDDVAATEAGTRSNGSNESGILGGVSIGIHARCRGSIPMAAISSHAGKAVGV